MTQERSLRESIQKVNIGEKFSITPQFIAGESEVYIDVNDLGRINFSLLKANPLNNGYSTPNRFIAPYELKINMTMNKHGLSIDPETLPVTIFGMLNLYKPISDSSDENLEFSVTINGSKYLFPCDGVGGDKNGNVYDIYLGTLTDEKGKEVVVKADHETFKNIQFLVTGLEAK